MKYVQPNRSPSSDCVIRAYADYTIYRLTSVTEPAILGPRGGSRIPGKGVYMFNGVGIRFADVIVFLLIPHENGIILSH